MFGHVWHITVKKRPKVPPIGLKCNCLFKYYKTLIDRQMDRMINL